MNIVVLPGNDSGPKITAAALAMIERANTVHSPRLKFESRDAGGAEVIARTPQQFQAYLKRSE